MGDPGDTIDMLLLTLDYKLWLHPRLVRGEVKTMGVIPFEAERGFVAHFYQDKSRVKVAVKGAVERSCPDVKVCRPARVSWPSTRL